METGELHLLPAKHQIWQHLLVLTVTLASQSKLQQLDVDQISSQLAKYDACVHQLEEGLPKNSLVADLKDKLEVTRGMVGNTAPSALFQNPFLTLWIYPSVLIQLPVITDLRQLCVDQESWKNLETILGSCLDVETLTLAFLEELDIISHATEIKEVTNQLGNTNFWQLNN